MTASRRLPALLLTAAALTLAGCASSATSGASPSASTSSVQAAIQQQIASQAAANPAPSPAGPAYCTTRACIVSDAEQSLPGITAENASVMTKAVCYKSTVVHHAAAKTWTVECLVS